jgi:hypothetical protein
MNKKAIAILGAIFLLIVGTLGFLIYSKYGGKQAVTPPVSQGQEPGTPATTTPPIVDPPPPAGPAFVKLLDDQVVSPALFYNGKGVTYFDTQGQLHQATFSAGTPIQIGSQQSLDIEPHPGITKVLWPSQGDNFIAQVEKTTGGYVWSAYNSSNRSFVDLPSQVKSISWLPSGDQVLFVWLENGKATLNSGDHDTKNWKYIADMWETDDAIEISPDGKNVLYYEQNSSSSTNPVYLTTPDGKIWKTLVKSGYNSGVLWSPDSQKFLFGKRTSSGQFQLWYYNLLTDEVKNLGFATIPEKAAWDQDSQTIYVAVPTSGTAGGSNLTIDTP